MKKSQFPDEQGEDGAFERQEDAFRNFVSRDAQAEFPYAAGRYHLYVCLACPWAHRSLIVRNLLGLEDVLGVSRVDPVRDDRGWAFTGERGTDRDAVNGFAFLSEAYRASDPGFRGRVTVPVLWDRETRQIVNNSEDDICRMFAEVFLPESQTDRPDVPDLFPLDRADEQEAVSDLIYNRIANGVYKAGFSTSQKVYAREATALFKALDEIEARLANGGPYLLGDAMTEADLRLFCVLVRFDAVYFGHFKCNVRRISDYPALTAFLRRLVANPVIRDTIDLNQIKTHYYYTHDDINPHRIIPIGPALDWAAGIPGGDL